MKRVFIFVLAVFTAVGMTVAGCKKQDAPKAGHKKSSSSKKSSTTKKTVKSSDTKSSKKKKVMDVPSM